MNTKNNGDIIKVVSAESVCEGHPDKLCDVIADSILDACIEKDIRSRVACEVMATKGRIYIAGEISCKDYVDYRKVSNRAMEMVGYNPDEFSFDIQIHRQSQDIAFGVTKENDILGAGDQGVVYGYACDESEEALPLPVVFANRICRLLDIARHHKAISGLKPDGKCLVGVEYINGKPSRIDSVVVSIQHDESTSRKYLEDAINTAIFPHVFVELPLDDKTKVFINPSGRFVEGGPAADTGLTGRKLMVDTYGGIAHHGGGAFSGKDATKVDRSGAYFARYVAKNVVAAGLANKCEVTITYAIGYEKPVSVEVNTFGTNTRPVEEIKAAILKVFDFTPIGIIKELKLREPTFRLSTCYGHFGKSNLTWESTKKVANLTAAISGKE